MCTCDAQMCVFIARELMYDRKKKLLRETRHPVWIAPHVIFINCGVSHQCQTPHLPHLSAVTEKKKQHFFTLQQITPLRPLISKCKSSPKCDFSLLILPSFVTHYFASIQILKRDWSSELWVFEMPSVSVTVFIKWFKYQINSSCLSLSDCV